MRLTHPTRLAVLLASLILAPPLAAQIEGGLRVQPRAQAPGNGNVIIVWPRHLQTLQARLDSFAVALPAEERALWEGVLLRAGHAPTPAAAEMRVTPVLEIGPGGGCEDSPGMTEAANRVAIVVQGGRTAGASGIVVQGGRTPSSGIVVQGGRMSGRVQGGTAPPPNPAGAVAISRPEDPTQPPPRNLGHRLASFSQGLPVEERAALDWLLTRAAAEAELPGTPVGLPPGPCTPEGGCRPPVGGSPLSVSLRQALGIDPLVIDLRPESPTRRRTEERWILRY